MGGEKKGGVFVRRKRQIIWDYQFLGQFQDTKEQRSTNACPYTLSSPSLRLIATSTKRSFCLALSRRPDGGALRSIRRSSSVDESGGFVEQREERGELESEKKLEEERKHGVADGVGFGGECSGERREKVAVAIPIAAFSHRASAGFVPVFQSLVSAGCQSCSSYCGLPRIARGRGFAARSSGSSAEIGASFETHRQFSRWNQ
jgi:hypothetical protein